MQIKLLNKFIKVTQSCINLCKFKNFTTKMSTEDNYYEAALKLTKNAGELIRNRIYNSKTVEVKSSDIDLVTETDKEVENMLVKGLSSQFPDHKFIGEEDISAGNQCNLTNAPTWIIDPVDGTLNFVHGFPHSCISIALFIDANPVIGIVYNPMLDQLFTARKGKGAYLNGRKILVSGQTSLSKALVLFETGTSRDPERMKFVNTNFQTLIPIVHGVRMLGSAALNMAMVALGGGDAYYECGIHIWDIAAGELLVTEAGGVVIDPAGGPIDRLSRRMLCASSEALAQEIVKNIVQHYPTPRD